jgi:ABC-type uncharacterized transport system permease subunit
VRLICSFSTVVKIAFVSFVIGAIFGIWGAHALDAQADPRRAVTHSQTG